MMDLIDNRGKNEHENRPDPSWNASEIEIPKASFEIAPIASQNPARNSTTPVHATWNDLLPGMYQKPQAPCAGIMFSNPKMESNICIIKNEEFRD